MANNTFEIVGKMTMGKESEKFQPFSKKVSEKGWETTELNITAIAKTNRHFLRIKGGMWENKQGVIYSFTKGGTDAEGNKIKGESIQVNWEDRMNPEILADIAEFKKFVIDLEEPGVRFKLKKAIEKFNESELSEDDIESLNIEDLSNLDIEDVVQLREKQKEILESALDRSNKKRREFISSVDYAEFINKLITSGKFDDKIFRIKGEIEYSSWNGKTYKNMIPNRIYLAKKDEEQISEGQMTLFYNKGCIQEVEGKHYISAYTMQYDQNSKATIPFPVSVVIDTTKDEQGDKQAKLHKILVSQFTVKDKSWKELGVKLNLLNGSQKVEITEDMLTDFQKEMLECEAMTMDDIRAELGGDIYGKSVEEMVVLNVVRGYAKGRKDTMYSDKNFVIQEVQIKEDLKTETEDDDIFGDYL